MKACRIGVLTIISIICLFLARGCSNCPWPSKWSGTDTFYTSYTNEIKTLDPANAYYVHEGNILDAIVEMPLNYDYLNSNTLIPVLLETMPEVSYYNASGKILENNPPDLEVSRGDYLLTLRRGILYQPHPCFATDSDGINRNLIFLKDKLDSLHTLAEFPFQKTREMTSMDFKVALTRLCDARLASPVFSNLSSFIQGMAACKDAIAQEVQRQENLPENADRNTALHPIVVDYRTIPFDGIEIIDRYHFKIKLTRKYPQAKYWMAMHFFAPVPQEALTFYGTPAVSDAGFQMKNWPIGTGAYMMTECRPRERIVLKRNPNYRDVMYPDAAHASPEDISAGLTADAGKKLPFISRLVFNYERETLPVWMKFQQGYYDDSGIPSDMFDSAVNLDASGDMNVNDELAAHQVRMLKAVQATTFYLAFNMLDETVGGLTPQTRKLRQAISIALDFHEFVDIFSNGRDVAAQSIIPPNVGIRGASELNPFTDERDPATGSLRRQSIERAKQLLVEAGYPAGVGPDGQPLCLYYDATSSAGTWKQQYQWMRKKLAPLGIQLEARVSDTNRHRDKLSTGDWQMMMKGWVADYPDPENFLFLFYSLNGTVKHHGINYSNYSSKAFDDVFKRLETMEDGPERDELLTEAVHILQEDAPFIWAYHRRDLLLVHDWYQNYKPHSIGNSFMQYRRINGKQREQLREAWNRPVLWPVYGIIACAYAAGVWMIVKRRA